MSCSTTKSDLFIRIHYPILEGKKKLSLMALVLDALASYVQNMLTEMAKEEVNMLLGVSDEINKMGDKLRDLKKFLADADRRSIREESVQAWVKQLRLAMYDATDIMDLCQLKAMEQGPGPNVGCFNPLLFCMRNPLHAHDIGSRIKSLNERLDDIKKRSENFAFINLGPREDHRREKASSHLASRETSAELDELGIVGEKIEEDTRNIVRMLTQVGERNHDDNKIVVFAIVGVGGIGKTTLAQKVFNNEVIQQEFTKKIWLSVNQEFNDAELLKRAITEAEGEYQAIGDSKCALERALKKALNGCKTLLVMDDVWSYHEAWETLLKLPLTNSVAQGSRVLVTTRHDTVARGMMALEPYHRVVKLEPQDAWSLLRKQVVRIRNDEPQVDMLKDIGMRIVEKCDCLPLAVKVLGGLLRQKNTTRGDWGKVLDDSIWSVSQMHEELNYAIYLSYQDLHPSLKLCFLHYSLLPKSKLFYRNDIVGMWISEGFVHGNSPELEELGTKYHRELILRNLIEAKIQCIDQNVCTMHDIVRSFAQYMARDEALVAHSSENDIIGKLKSQKFIQLSLETHGSESSELEWSSLRAQVSLRTLILFGHMKIKHGDSLVTFSSLRTLDIRLAKCDALVENLHQLKHLRYLSLVDTDISGLPESLGKMKFLQHISLARSKSLVKLPSSIAELRQLRYLNINGTSINSIPRGLGSLTNLRIFAGFPAHMDVEWCSLEELGPLSQLTCLEIDGLEKVSSSSSAIEARLRGKLRLKILQLRCTSRSRDNCGLVNDGEGIHEEKQQRIKDVFDELRPPPCLEYLLIGQYFGRQLPRWMMSTATVLFGSLRTVVMRDLPCCTELPDGLCHLPCLELLQINSAPAIKRVGPEFLQHRHHRHNCFQVVAAFPRLLKLELFGMVEWEEWQWDERVQAMPLLAKLVIQRCKLRRVPPGLAFHARALRTLVVHTVEHLRSLENFPCVVQLDLVHNPCMERISNFQELQKLIIINCPKMKVLEHVPALHRLILEDYRMQTLPRYLQNVSPRHMQLDCSLWLLTSIAAGKCSLEWNKFRHVQQVKAYAHEKNIRRKWYVLYTRDPFSFETNISPSTIAQAKTNRMDWKFYTFYTTCPIEEDWPVGRHAYAPWPTLQPYGASSGTCVGRDESSQDARLGHQLSCCWPFRARRQHGETEPEEADGVLAGGRR
ncbi:hypothetical protein ACP4OV_014611 [Aristida adscensionis]